MLVPSLLTVYFVFVGLSLHVLAFLLYRHKPYSPELRFVARYCLHMFRKSCLWIAGVCVKETPTFSNSGVSNYEEGRRCR